MRAADVAAVGAHLTAYWRQKKCMAPDAEPPRVSRMIQALAPECHGYSLAVCPRARRAGAAHASSPAADGSMSWMARCVTRRNL